MNESLHPMQIEILRRMTPAERFSHGLRFLKMTREWLAAGVRSRHPEWPPSRIAQETRRLIDHARS